MSSRTAVRDSAVGYLAEMFEGIQGEASLRVIITPS